MPELLPKADHDIEREELQNYLATIDRDTSKLQSFIGELYRNSSENPHVLYAAATYLTSLTYLDRRDEKNHIVLPERQEAGRAFSIYTQLLHMLAIEKDAPRYINDERVRKRLAGTREELAFHATLAYATAQGADFVALPTPASVDFTGAAQASDVQVFFDEAEEADLEIQVKYQPGGYFYHPRIAILNLATVLGDADKAAKLRSMLKAIGEQNHDSNSTILLPPQEHDVIMIGSAAIMEATYDWGSPEVA